MPEPIFKSKKTKCIRVSEYSHVEVSKYISEEGDDIKIGKFFEKAALEKLSKIKERNSLFSKFSTQTLISNRWKKAGNSTYQRDDNVVVFTGTYWLHNGERLTEDNYIDKIYDKTLAKVPNPPIKKKNDS